MLLWARLEGATRSAWVHKASVSCPTATWRHVSVPSPVKALTASTPSSAASGVGRCRAAHARHASATPAPARTAHPSIGK